MNKIFYPAIFHQEDIGYSVWLPDIDGCISQGDNLDESIENIKDALGLYFEDYKFKDISLPKASNPNDIELEKNEFIALIEFDWLSYSKKHDNKAIKKTLSIPAWLNSIAEEQHVNFSGVLQEALIQKLNIR